MFILKINFEREREVERELMCTFLMLITSLKLAKFVLSAFCTFTQTFMFNCIYAISLRNQFSSNFRFWTTVNQPFN